MPEVGSGRIVGSTNGLLTFTVLLGLSTSRAWRGGKSNDCHRVDGISRCFGSVVGGRSGQLVL